MRVARKIIETILKTTKTSIVTVNVDNDDHKMDYDFVNNDDNANGDFSTYKDSQKVDDNGYNNLINNG